MGTMNLNRSEQNPVLEHRTFESDWKRQNHPMLSMIYREPSSTTENKLTIRMLHRPTLDGTMMVSPNVHLIPCGASCSGALTFD